MFAFCSSGSVVVLFVEFLLDEVTTVFAFCSNGSVVVLFVVFLYNDVSNEVPQTPAPGSGQTDPPPVVDVEALLEVGHPPVHWTTFCGLLFFSLCVCVCVCVCV